MSRQAIPPPTFISIGSFLIDAFDTQPRPVIDKNPLPVHPAFTRQSGPPTPESPCPDVPLPRQSHLPTIPPIHLPICIDRRSVDTPIATPTGSGSSTPQLQFAEPPSERPIEYLGGGGLYSLIGARLFLPADQLKTLVDRAIDGVDLRRDLQDQINVFGDMFVWNEGEQTQMTRSRIGYDGDTRLYHPIIKPPHRKLSDLIGTPLEHGQYLHIAPPFSSQDVATLQDEIRNLSKSGKSGWSPRLVFEPTPPSCHLGQRSWLEKVAPGCHVLSPNHEELLSFYGHPKFRFTDPILVDTLEKVMLHLLNSVGVGQDGQGILAVRCGRMGACIGTRKGGLRWFPAYYTGEEESRVKDVTGAGNAFIGGYVAGLTITDDAYQATLFATVAASFVVEQVGLPSMSPATPFSKEMWNDAEPLERVESLRSKWTMAGLL